MVKWKILTDTYEKKKNTMCVNPPLLILVLVHIYMMSFLNGVFNIHSTITNNDYYDKRKK